MNKVEEDAMPRPTEPEGYPLAMRRLRWDLHNLWSPSAAMRRDARADLGHALVNVPVEWCRDCGVPWPKLAGKALAVATIAVPVSIAVWIILVMT